MDAWMARGKKKACGGGISEADTSSAVQHARILLFGHSYNYSRGVVLELIVP